ncbi:hypothetical protein MAE02_45680 [Microvirga aerophila]|uniref:Tetratricopeptide repeat protein n=2 Tax=Microvirga aerophila TaxID=670291 RepID=A0A512BY39_9HYPH|nr:hypothetical protein MAE02_45680 [Microvirga aerophila]
MLVRLERVDEAVAYARESCTAPSESLELAKVLRDAGRHDEALAIAEGALRLGADLTVDGNCRPGHSLAHWLRDYAGLIVRRDLALAAARAAFEQTRSLDDYRPVETWAGEGWTGIRQIARQVSGRWARP